MSTIFTSKRENTVIGYTNKMRRHMENLSVTEKLLLSVIFTMLTGVAAKVRIPFWLSATFGARDYRSG